MGLAYAMPRVGDEELARWYDLEFGRRTESFVHVVDGVPDMITRTPRRAWGFRHLGEGYIVTNQGELHHGTDPWHGLCDDLPVGNREAWRVLRQLRLGVEGHLGKGIHTSLQRVVDPEGAAATPSDPSV